MNLDRETVVVGAVSVPEDTSGITALTVTDGGFGKRTKIDDFPVQNRGGKGIICHRINEKTGDLVGLELVEEADDCMIITDEGIIIRTAVTEIPVYGRTTSGVIVMRTATGSKVTGFTKVTPEKDEGSEDSPSEGETEAEEDTDFTENE